MYQIKKRTIGKTITHGLLFRLWAVMCILTAVPAMAEDGPFDDESAKTYASMAGAGYYYVADQTVKLWAPHPTSPVTSNGTVDHDNVTVIQGPDQNWGGTGNIMPGIIKYENVWGKPDYAAAGFGGGCVRRHPDRRV